MRLLQENEIEDADLLLNLCRGDREALSYVFTMYYPYLFNYGLKIVSNNEELVKDCIQDVFLSIWRRRKNLVNVKSLKPYLFSALRLRLYRQLEKQTSRIDRNHKYFYQSFDDTLNVEELIILFEIQKEQKEKLLSALNKLSNRKKEALYLKFYDGLSNEEIALVMGINTQSVYNHISEAIQLLKNFID
ncbi:MAG TPA: sigma-70 family RNA polymerase sigma factor [Bacteroidales bacterium]|nr:sigma-70 family RNA polymerase sigma factor [Balneolales bacterium]HYX06654.1 sigma-70 family RNA polymerase sigma factor [Bacteroidales bacterium]